MTLTHPLSFGIKTSQQQTSYEAILPLWLEADAEPAIEHAWLFDHFIALSDNPMDPCLEGWTLLSALAAMTKRVRIGIMVPGNTYRHPAVFAKMGATLDIISNGRLDFGLGAGWNEREHSAYGIPLYKAGERIHRLEEACELIQRMWTETAPTFEGRYYQLKEAYCEPKPVQKPHPPFVIGGGGEKLTLRVVAKYAHIWNLPGGTVEELKHKADVLTQHCQTIGRDPNSIIRSIQLVINPDNLDETRATVYDYMNIGVSHFILNIRPPYPKQIIRRLVTEVIKPLQAIQS